MNRATNERDTTQEYRSMIPLKSRCTHCILQFIYRHMYHDTCIPFSLVCFFLSFFVKVGGTMRTIRDGTCIPTARLLILDVCGELYYLAQFVRLSTECHANSNAVTECDVDFFSFVHSGTVIYTHTE